MIIWLDGSLMPLEEARISPIDRGLTVGDGVFETLRVYNGLPFAWTRHERRLRVSADGLGLKVVRSEVLRSAALEVIAANDLSEARLRITVTGGEGPLGSSRHDAVERTIVVAVPFSPTAASTRIVTVPWTRNERSATAGLKTLSYAANVRALAYAEARGATEALFTNTKDNVCEATGSNIFAVIDGELLTPPPSAGCLLGVTRGILLELAHSLSIRCAERDFSIDEIRQCTELFLSSSTREVQQITHLDDEPIGNSTTPISRQLAAAYAALVQRDLDPT